MIPSTPAQSWATHRSFSIPQSALARWLGSLLLVLALGVLAVPTAQGQCFAPSTTLAVGTDPRSVGVGDFNADGRPDLAVANSGSGINTVSVLLGQGSGSFAAATNFAVGDRPFYVAVGDFNADGKPDLAVANYFSNNVSVLLGQGNGSFAAATNFAVGNSPASVAVGDFNADGKPDLAVANQVSNNVSVLLGQGNGSFAAATNFGVGLGPRSVAVGDFNADGKPDLAITNANSKNVSVLLGQGNGSFAAATNFGVGSGPISVAVGDFNADGKPDLAVANSGSGINTVSVLLGQGNGSFAVATNFGVGSSPASVAVGDFNADGKPDLATANINSSNVSVLLGQGNGSFAAATNFVVGSGPASVAAGDFNADGKVDLAAANINSSNVSVLTNTTTLVSVVSQPPSSSAVCAGSPVSVPISVSGSATSYQWYKDGALVSGQTSATLSLPNAQTTDQGSYSVVVTGACYSLTSTTFSLTVSSPPTRLYVNANARGKNTGQSWDDAFNDLQSALRYTCAQNLTEIWVATGVYKPSTNVRGASFSMKNGVAIYGGFEGNEQNLTDRPTINPVSGNPSSSTLSGDLGIADNPADNSLQIIFNSGLNNSAILDGFVITGANSTAGGTGGGMNNQSSSPVITNCSFVNNSSYQYGGAIYNNNSSPVLTNCVFMNNKADFLGGAIYSITGSVGSTLVITNCAFLSNTAVNGGGAAIYNNNATEVITNCSFQGNRGALGRIIYNTLGRVVMTNCALFNNGGVNTFYNNGSITAAYSLLESTVTGYIDGGNNLTTTTSPFISTTSVALTPCTSAINAGDPATTSATAGNTDLAANPRFFNNGRIDIGAVEFQGSPNAPIAFTASLASTSVVCAGTALSVPTSISGTVSSYQWYKDGNALSSQTSATLSLTNVQTTDQGSYSVVVTGACNSLTSTAFSLTVNATPSVSINPTSATLTSASPSVSLTAIGFGTYLWSTGETSQVISVTSSGIYSVTLTTQGGCTASTSANVPGVDLTVALELPQAQFGTSGTAATGNFLVNVFEVGGLATSSGNVTITITAPVGYTLSFVPTLTSIDVSGGSRVVVNNGVWTVSHSLEARQLSLTMNSGAFIGAGGKSSVGLSLTRTTASSGSTANITVNVADDLTMRYDGNLSNNGYARIISGL